MLLKFLKTLVLILFKYLFMFSGLIINSDLDPFSSSLSFPRLQTEHSGNYTCVGSNSVAQDSQSSLLLVNGKKPITFYS